MDLWLHIVLSRTNGWRTVMTRSPLTFAPPWHTSFITNYSITEIDSMLLIMLNRDLVSIQMYIKSVIFPYLLIINQLSTLSYPLIHSQLLINNVHNKHPCLQLWKIYSKHISLQKGSMESDNKKNECLRRPTTDCIVYDGDILQQ